MSDQPTGQSIRIKFDLGVRETFCAADELDFPPGLSGGNSQCVLQQPMAMFPARGGISNMDEALDVMFRDLRQVPDLRAM